MNGISGIGRISGIGDREIRIGLLGCGVVGTGIVQVLHNKWEDVLARMGVHLNIKRIVVNDLHRARDTSVDRQKLTSNWFDVCTDNGIDIVVEVMGGSDIAREAVLTALQHGKSVVTANKELVARYGAELRQVAKENAVDFRYEASVLAGVPAIHPLQAYFSINRVTAIRGIVNGTCNYILTKMHDDNLDMDEALRGAQTNGYAERDPSMDIDGLDANYKLDILLDTFGLRADGRATERKVEGIRHVTKSDVDAAKKQGLKLKHLVTASWQPELGEVVCKVGVESLSSDDPLYTVDGVENALNIHADIVGDLTFRGPGAGAYPTASAVLEDVMHILAKRLGRVSGLLPTALKMV